MEIKRFSDFIICPIPAVSELDQAEIEQIVTHTHNTCLLYTSDAADE